jgi:SAM-dependent methyltransferase
VGIDMEPIECRDAETWRALLHDDGYAQALMHARATSESFDCAATRVWALLESSKKAHNLRRILPRYDAPRGGAWHSSTSMTDGMRVENLSVIVSNGQDMPRAALAVTLPCAQPTAAADSRAAEREFDAVLEDFTQHVRAYATQFARDPEDPETEAHHAEFNACIDATVARLAAVERVADASALYEMRQRMLARLSEFLGDSEIVRHAIDKPYGYTGDFEMLEKLLQNKTNATGFGYHMDRAQLEYPASEACRYRATWVGDEAQAIVAARGTPELRLLDIGIGSAPVERTLLERIPGLALDVRAIDIEPAALAFVEQQLKGRVRSLDLRRVDLRREESAVEVAAMAHSIDLCVAIGIFEALRDEELIRLLQTLRQAMPPGSLILGEAFLPSHPTRAHMEWFMDYHLGYRSPDEVCALLERAGVAGDHLQLPVEPSGSSGLFRITV